jgi:hypothetical protein
MWTMMWESESVFFRTGGSLAAESDRANGKQEDHIRSIKGLALISQAEAYPIISEVNGIFTNTPISNVAIGVKTVGGLRTGYILTLDANSGTTTDNPMAGHAGGADIHPMNRRFIIWKRTA